MKKEIGKWFFDIAKYVATAVLISSFLSGFEQKSVMYIVGLATISFTFLIGVVLMREKKNKKRTNKK
ncbi:MAG: hypothetical protein FWH18_03775 [Marinilabiliaceae bacterium]|nr:hypothetical protein [Marinilabiliaceae bacterium]